MSGNQASLVTIFLRSRLKQYRMVHANAARRSPFARSASRLVLGCIAFVVILGLAGIAWALNDAIERHHDRIALKGLDGKPSPVAVTVGSESLVIPANLIRF